MKESRRLFLLKILAVVTVQLSVLSLMTAGRTSLFGGGGELAGAALYLFWASAGFVAGWWLIRDQNPLMEKLARFSLFDLLLFSRTKTEKTRVMASMIAYVSILFPAATTFLLYLSQSIWRALYEGVFLLLAYSLSIGAGRRHFSEIAGKAAFTAGFVLLGVSLELSYFHPACIYLKPYLFALAYVYLLLFLVITNQGDIDANIYAKRHVEKSFLPRNMRIYHIKAVMLVFVLILGLFYLKPLVLLAIRLASRVVALIGSAVMWFLNLLLPDMGPIREGKQPPQNFGFFGGEELSVNPWTHLVENILKYFILFYALYKLAPLLYSLIRKLAKRLSDLFRRLIGRWSDNRDTAVEDYFDETETIKPLNEAGRKRELHSRFRRARRELRSITDAGERIRYFYGSILCMLPVCGVEVEPSDTTGEVYRKSRHIQGVESPLAILTALYNRVRYGGFKPAADELDGAEDSYYKTADILRKL